MMQAWRLINEACEWVEAIIICKPILLLQRVLNKADLCIKYVMMIIL